MHLKCGPISNYIFHIRKYIRDLLRSIFGIFLLFFDSIALLFYSRTRHDENSILLIRVDNLGDFILWYSQAIALRNEFPKPLYKLNLVCNKVSVDIAQASGLFDEIIPFDQRKFITSLYYRYSIISKIRHLKCFTLINPIFSRDFYRQDALARLSGAKKLIAYDCDCTNITPFLKRISSYWYTKLILKNDSSLSEIDRNIDFMLGLGIQPNDALSDLSSLTPFGEAGFKKLFLPLRYFVIFPGASWSGRKWPAEYFAQLANLIQDKFNIDGLICGSVGDDEIARQINSYLSRPLINVTGKTSLLTLITLVKNSCLVISNESGGAHLAPALKVPTVCILGGGHFGRFAPYPTRFKAATLIPTYKLMNCYGCNWGCIHKLDVSGSAPCVSEISVNTVFHAVMDALENSYKCKSEG